MKDESLDYFCEKIPSTFFSSAVPASKMAVCGARPSGVVAPRARFTLHERERAGRHFFPADYVGVATGFDSRIVVAPVYRWHQRPRQYSYRQSRSKKRFDIWKVL